MNKIKTDAETVRKRKLVGAKALSWLGQGLRGTGQAVNWMADGLADLSEKGSKQLSENGAGKEDTPKNG